VQSLTTYIRDFGALVQHFAENLATESSARRRNALRFLLEQPEVTGPSLLSQLEPLLLQLQHYREQFRALEMAQKASDEVIAERC
jgi:hypothetical protein